jgi:uncharacterized protein
VGLASGLAAARAALAFSTQAYAGQRLAIRVKQHVRWSLLAALAPEAALPWFALLRQSSMRPFCLGQPVLPLKPLRPYGSLRWDRQRRMKVIADSYALIRGGPAVLSEAVLNPNGAELASVTLPEAERLGLHLGWNHRFRKEGELVLSLRTGARELRALAMALAFEREPSGTWRCYIGCVQGGDETPEQIRKLTKLLHGLRPKSLLLFVAQELSQALGVRTLLGVSDAIQVYRSKQLIHLPRHAIQMKYDQQWQEAGGVLDADAWYRLPLQARRRARLDIPANKRAQYTRRYALMDELAAQIRSCLQIEQSLVA